MELISISTCKRMQHGMVLGWREVEILKSQNQKFQREKNNIVARKQNLCRTH
jgi:hypothetical protein